MLQNNPRKLQASNFCDLWHVLQPDECNDCGKDSSQSSLSFHRACLKIFSLVMIGDINLAMVDGMLRLVAF